ncbi:MAG: hypothetical protein ACR2NL_03730, partial [Acidimicrobiia bacterium]
MVGRSQAWDRRHPWRWAAHISFTKIRVREQSARTARVGFLVAVALVSSSCAADESGSPTIAAPTTTVLDCVAAGTCSDEPDGTLATATTSPAEMEGTYKGLPVGFTDDGFPYLGDI